jgi:ribosome-binding protein aMBF1 (putative translation factor)
MAKTRDANRILNDVTGDDEELQQMIAEETINAEVARLIYKARKMAGLTQTELAKLIGSKQPVIARLEDADYEGHSLTMLQRIAIALNQKVEINFVPVEGQQEVV